MPSLEERQAETAGAVAVGAEVVDVAVVVVAQVQEEIVSPLVAAQEQTRKRLLIKLSSLEIYQALYFLKTCLPTCINENSTILSYIPPILLGYFIITTLHRGKKDLLEKKS